MVLVRLEIGVSVLHRPGSTGWVLSPLQHKNRTGRTVVSSPNDLAKKMCSVGWRAISAEIKCRIAGGTRVLQPCWERCMGTPLPMKIVCNFENVIHRPHWLPFSWYTHQHINACRTLNHTRSRSRPTGRSHFKARQNEEAGNECSYLSEEFAA